MGSVAIVDYGMCNLDSVARAVEECGGKPLISDRPSDLENASRIILPGVGAFPDAMRNLRQRGLDQVIVEQALQKRIPFLGICLGMQLLASCGSEFEETSGLGLIPGEVVRLQPWGDDRRIPHIGWNEVHFDQRCPLFKGISLGHDFYFVHSYHFCPRDAAHAVGRTPYGKGFVSVVQRELVFGTQFHPEKSQKTGFQVLKNFLQL
jgi:glutamine amidotransferase